MPKSSFSFSLSFPLSLHSLSLFSSLFSLSSSSLSLPSSLPQPVSPPVLCVVSVDGRVHVCGEGGGAAPIGEAAALLIAALCTTEGTTDELVHTLITERGADKTIEDLQELYAIFVLFCLFSTILLLSFLSFSFFIIIFIPFRPPPLVRVLSSAGVGVSIPSNTASPSQTPTSTATRIWRTEEDGTGSV